MSNQNRVLRMSTPLRLPLEPGVGHSAFWPLPKLNGRDCENAVALTKPWNATDTPGAVVKAAGFAAAAAAVVLTSSSWVLVSATWVRVCSTWVWAWLIWLCCCCWVDSSNCTWRSSSATRDSSAFSLAVSAKAMPGASKASSMAVASGLRSVVTCLFMVPLGFADGRMCRRGTVAAKPACRFVDAPIRHWSKEMRVREKPHEKSDFCEDCLTRCGKSCAVLRPSSKRVAAMPHGCMRQTRHNGHGPACTRIHRPATAHHPHVTCL